MPNPNKTTREQQAADDAAEEKSIADSNARFDQALSDLQDETARCTEAGETPPTFRDAYRLLDAAGVEQHCEVDLETVLALKEENPELSWGL